MIPLLAAFAAGTSACAKACSREGVQASKGEKRDPKKQLSSVPLPTSAANVANAGMAAFLFGQLG